MSEDSPLKTDIEIGDTRYTIPRFKGLKAIIAGGVISRVMTELPQLQDKAAIFRQEFRRKNTIIITPAMAKLPRFAALGLETEDFEAAGGNIELPEEPDNGTVFMHVFPLLFELARKEMEKFLALLVIPNSELEAADDADTVEEALSRKGKLLMRQGDIDQLMELLSMGREVLQTQMSSNPAAASLGKLLPGLFAALRPQEEEVPAELSDGPGQTWQTPTGDDQSPSQSSAPPSSSDSQLDSDGIEEQLSTASPGMS